MSRLRDKWESVWELFVADVTLHKGPRACVMANGNCWMSAANIADVSVGVTGVWFPLDAAGVIAEFSVREDDRIGLIFGLEGSSG